MIVDMGGFETRPYKTAHTKRRWLPDKTIRE